MTPMMHILSSNMKLCRFINDWYIIGILVVFFIEILNFVLETDRNWSMLMFYEVFDMISVFIGYFISKERTLKLLGCHWVAV